MTRKTNMKTCRRRRTHGLSIQRLEDRRLLVGELLELHLTPRNASDVSLLDGARHASVQVGEVFAVEVSYDDLRPSGDGAFGLYTNIASSQSEVLEPLLRETQTVRLGAEIQDAAANEVVTFSMAGNATTVTRTVAELTAALPTQWLKEIYSDLGFASSGLRVLDQSVGTTESVYDVIFTDIVLANTDVPNLSISTEAFAASVTDIPAILPSGELNPDAVPRSLDLRSRTFVLDGITNQEFILNLVEGSIDDVDGSLIGVGGIGQPALSVDAIDSRGVFETPFDMFSIYYRALSPATNVEFSVELNAEVESVLYPGVALTPDMVVTDAKSKFTLDITSDSPYTTNPIDPRDINRDGLVGPFDAFLVHSRLNLRGNSPAQIGVEPSGASLDASADGRLNALDLGLVINFLVNQSGGEGESGAGGEETDTKLLSYTIDAKSLDGASLLDEDRHLALAVGDRFTIEIGYVDLRTGDDELGALSLFADLVVSTGGVIRPLSPESFLADIQTFAAYSVSNTASFASAATAIFDELGGVGQVVPPDDASGPQSVLQFVVEVTERGSDIVFGLESADDLDSVNMLYGRDLPLGLGNVEFGSMSRFTATFGTSNVTALDDDASTKEDSPVLIDVLSNDVISDATTVELVVASASANGGVVEVTQDNQIRYTPPSDFGGDDTFEYEVIIDGVSSGIRDTATVTVRVAYVLEQGAIQVNVVDGNLVVQNEDGETITTSGNTLTIEASLSQVFESEATWVIEGTEVVNGVLVQIAQSGDVIVRVIGSGWTNFVAPTDVDGSGESTALDALAVINELNASLFSNSSNFSLLDPVTGVEMFPNLFFDTNGDGFVTAIDALEVINRLLRQDLEGPEPELASEPASFGFVSSATALHWVSTSGTPSAETTIHEEASDHAVGELSIEWDNNPHDRFDELSFEDEVSTVQGTSNENGTSIRLLDQI